MQTRIASYSKLNKKPSANAIKEAYKNGETFDLEITDFSHPDCGKYVSPQELKAAGHSYVYIRFKSDTQVMRLAL